ncbi:MAG: phospho-N-acetylmuramoyl-pentapeptide-transferase [Candidatus Midichloria sp.]|nr:MAG: phospho-N-acetylmuramoyl-pentapeptide-transferase [Candidatus Midichloria sp.]
MLYYFLSLLISKYHIFNVVKYITFRSIAATFTALIVSFFIGPRIIKLLKSIQRDGQPIRVDGPKSHIVNKKGTPTMGGLMIIISILLSTFLWADLSNCYIWVCLFLMLSFAALGFLDDYKKLKYRNSKGVSSKLKLSWQFITALITSITISRMSQNEIATMVFFPFYKNLTLDLGILYFLFASVVVIGSSNAVNLTDGLDGLATLPVIIVACCFALISYLVGNFIFANYLQIQYVQGVGEISIFCATIIGAGLGFLWYNAPPAKVFMGDIGSLSLGGAIGTISVITKHEIVLFITGGLFVMEALSVIIQVGFYKLRGKRVFKMAPIHHHFEKTGWSEPTIVIRFWILAFIFALIGLSTLKLR